MDLLIQILIDFAMYGALYFVGLMLSFAIIMTIWARVENTILEIPAKIVLGIPFVIANFLFNWTVMTPVFWPDRPEKLFEQTTSRMKRYRRTGTGRRLRFANFVCRWLNRFDEDHC